MNGNTSCAPKTVHTKPPTSCDVGPPRVPSLMDIKTRPPVSSNQIRCPRNNGNSRCVLDHTATVIPSLTSIETRPPWETRPPYNNETSTTSLEHLQKTVAEQNDLINVLNSERKWLEADNNVQRFTVIRLKEQIAEYERYIQSREEAFALELNKVRQQAKEKEDEIQKEQNEKVQAVIDGCKYWKKAYYVKEEECTTMKRELHLAGRAFCRFFVERSLQRASDTSSRIPFLYGCCIDCTVQLEQLPTMKLSMGINMLTCTEASRGRTMDRLALPAPEVDAVSPAHPAGEIHFDAACFAFPAGEVSFNKALPTDISTLREMTGSLSLSLADLTSKICSSSTLSSCNAPLNPRTRQRGIALPSAPAGAVTPADLEEMHYNKASLEEKIVLGVESRSSFLWLELSTSRQFKISLCTSDDQLCKTLSQVWKWPRKLATTTPEAGASSPACLAEEIEVIEALPVLQGGAVSVTLPVAKTELIEVTRIDDITLRDKNNSGDTMFVSETIASNFASNNHEQQLSEANFVSGKKKKGRAGRFRRWLRKFCCCTSRDERECSDREETTF